MVSYQSFSSVWPNSWSSYPSSKEWEKLSGIDLVPDWQEMGKTFSTVIVKKRAALDRRGLSARCWWSYQATGGWGYPAGMILSLHCVPWWLRHSAIAWLERWGLFLPTTITRNPNGWRSGAHQRNVENETFSMIVWMKEWVKKIDYDAKMQQKKKCWDRFRVSQCLRGDIKSPNVLFENLFCARWRVRG